MSDLIDVLEGEANISIKWHKNYDMIANPVKFHALWIRKDRSVTSGVNISIQGKSIKSEDSVKFLGTKLENKLNVDSHISDLCNKAVTQLNVLKRLKSFIGFEERKVLGQSFICFPNFYYSPLVWKFSSAKSLQKVEKIHEGALRLLYDDNTSSYDALLVQSGRF